MKIWLDDERPIPSEFDCHIKTAVEAIELLAAGGVTAISLDHDLGDNGGTGYEVACYIEQAAYNGMLFPVEVAIHSANPVGRERMEQAINNARLFWSEVKLPIYEGIPKLFDVVIDLVEHRPVRDIKSIVAFDLLNEIMAAAEHAIVHYFSLTLNEDFLQKSHLGAPYQKWASVTNENFQKVDQYLKSLIPIIELFESECYNYTTFLIEERPELKDYLSSFNGAGYRNALTWLYSLKKEYACCIVNPDEPSLTLSAIKFDGWLDATSGRFTSELRYEEPPVVIKSEIAITDRSILQDLQSIGSRRTQDLNSSVKLLATWLEANYTMSDIITINTKDL